MVYRSARKVDATSLLIALDLSLSNTGYAVFKYKEIIDVGSIPTSSSSSTPKRLKTIFDELCRLKKTYSPTFIAIERGFYRNFLITEQLFRVHGIANLIFWDIPQAYYSPSTIKKLITDNGNASKEDVSRAITTKYYPNLNFRNDDESDAVAVGITGLIRQLKVRF